MEPETPTVSPPGCYFKNELFRISEVWENSHGATEYTRKSEKFTAYDVRTMERNTEVFGKFVCEISRIFPGWHSADFSWMALSGFFFYYIGAAA